jgi:hypothetical protein
MRDVEILCHDNIENRTDENDYAVTCVHSHQAIPVPTDVCSKYQIAMECVSEDDA